MPSGIGEQRGRGILMQSSNHVETSSPRYRSFSTYDLNSGSAVTNRFGPVEGDTEDYPEISGEFAPPQAAVLPDPKTARQLADETADDEETLWEGQTSGKNFLVRFLVGEALTVAWGGLAVATWGFGYSKLNILTIGVGAVLLLFWALTGLKLFRAIHSHHYRLTTRRLFVRTGLLRRRIDQIELVRVRDVYVQQSLIGKWLAIGHVVVVSSEQTLPRAILYGIDRPEFVMDLIGLRTRAELDNRTSRIEQVY
jgi:hypothetical protein